MVENMFEVRFAVIMCIGTKNSYESVFKASLSFVWNLSLKVSESLSIQLNSFNESYIHITRQI